MERIQEWRAFHWWLLRYQHLLLLDKENTLVHAYFAASDASRDYRPSRLRYPWQASPSTSIQLVNLGLDGLAARGGVTYSTKLNTILAAPNFFHLVDEVIDILVQRRLFGLDGIDTESWRELLSYHAMLDRIQLKG